MLTRIIDYGFRRAYRIAWPFVARYRRYYKQDGVCIALWANDRVLVVRHSYKEGLGLPGGGINRREPPERAALRELREEVGIDIASATLDLIYTKTYSRGNVNYFYEVHVPVEPDIKIDRREIIYAEFLSGNQIIIAGCDKYFASYLNNCAMRGANRLGERPEIDAVQHQQIVAMAGGNGA